MVAVERTGLSAEGAVHLEGGFRKNPGYAGILAALLGRRKLCLTDIPEATALGAAMTAVAALEGTAPDALGGRLGVEYRPVEPMRGIGEAELDKYAAAWLALVASDGGKA
jgi:sugar (pentulose or hexulose) kinase